jgi:hypothetical protein
MPCIFCPFANTILKLLPPPLSLIIQLALADAPVFLLHKNQILVTQSGINI